MKKLTYSNPECDYQRFVNAFQLKHSYVSNKDVVTNANKLWKEMKNDKNKVFFLFCLFHRCKKKSFKNINMYSIHMKLLKSETRQI